MEKLILFEKKKNKITSKKWNTVENKTDCAARLKNAVNTFVA
jgi:hypothetical protein